MSIFSTHVVDLTTTCCKNHSAGVTAKYQICHPPTREAKLILYNCTTCVSDKQTFSPPDITAGGGQVDMTQIKLMEVKHAVIIRQEKPTTPFPPHPPKKCT